MLPLLYATREDGWAAEYNAQYSAKALNGFLAELPDGTEGWLSAVGNMASELYGTALRDSGKHIFLDKTPRYYLVISELLIAFPTAKFIFLTRNPLAVFASILKTNFKDNISGFGSVDRIKDVSDGPRLLVQGAKTAGERGIVVRYEDIVKDPGRSFEAICHHLEVEFVPGMLEYGSQVRFEGTSFVDPKSIYRHGRPVADYADQWIQTYANPQLNRLGREYLARLGTDTINGLGFDKASLLSELHKLPIRPDNAWHRLRVPLDWVLTPRGELTLWKKATVDAVAHLGKGGIRGLTSAAVRRMFGTLVNG